MALFPDFDSHTVIKVTTDNPLLIPIFQALAGKQAEPQPAPVINTNGNGKVKRAYKKRGLVIPTETVQGTATTETVTNPGVTIIPISDDGAGVLRTIKAHGAIKGRRL